jgi:hypothetical protein
MKTKLEDLEADERELIQERDRVENDIKVIQAMIKIMKTMRYQGALQLDDTGDQGDSKTLREVIKREINHEDTGWVSAGQLSKRLSTKGVGTDKTWATFRASISSSLRRMADREEIQRYNKGTKEDPIYIYGSNKLGEYRDK